MRFAKFCAAGLNFQLHIFSMERIRTLSQPHDQARVHSDKLDINPRFINLTWTWLEYEISLQ